MDAEKLSSAGPFDFVGVEWMTWMFECCFKKCGCIFIFKGCVHFASPTASLRKQPVDIVGGGRIFYENKLAFRFGAMSVWIGTA